MKEERMKKKNDPQSLLTYFRDEKKTLAVITVTGLIYNIGMTAGPYFEGQLAQYLADIIQKKRMASDMVRLAITYVLVILIVQGARFIKRLYVRYFANHVNRRMKKALYRVLVHETKQEIQKDNAGSLMTKAVADVDDCVEGMRKFTTEIFDTGVVMIAYAVMLLWYDWRLAIIAMLFPPVAYFFAEKLKKAVTKAGKEAKESAGRLNEATLDNVGHALTYRTYGLEENQGSRYETFLADYEKKNVRAGFLETGTEPLYRAISMTGAFFILYFGGRNVLGIGWTTWNIAAFTAFLSCFTKLATKSSKAAKLFNAVQKAEVSWTRIRPLLKDVPEDGNVEIPEPGELDVSHVSFSYDAQHPIIRDLSFQAKPGEIIGITGPVACGKSTLGKLFLNELNYEGNITLNGKNLKEIYADRDAAPVSYLGHDPELFSDSVKGNIDLGRKADVYAVLNDVCLQKEISQLDQGVNTLTGESGHRFSGGQQQRIALARALADCAPVLILDDPFASVDHETEKEIFANLRNRYSDRIILLISHRLAMFPQMDQVLFLQDGTITQGTHNEMIQRCPAYRNLVEMQAKGVDYDEA